MTLVDSHCHLNYNGLVDDQQGVLQRARTAGVGAMLNISTRQSEWADVVTTAEREPDVWAAIGIHPHDADAHVELTSGDLLTAAAHPRVVAIGETGLDYHYDRSDRGRQRDSFRMQIDAARQAMLPVIVHTRDAEADTLAILDDGMRKGAFEAVIHCFTSTAAFARATLDLGCYISISGIVTFKAARDLQAIVADLPDDRLLIETDAPFLAPVPHRGQRCEPALLTETARFVAALRGVPIERLAEQTSENFYRLFAKATR